MMAACKFCKRTDEELTRSGRAKLGADKICDGCWEVSSRLDAFIRNPSGRVFVLEALLAEEKRRNR